MLDPNMLVDYNAMASKSFEDTPQLPWVTSTSSYRPSGTITSAEALNDGTGTSIDDLVSGSLNGWSVDYTAITTTVTTTGSLPNGIVWNSPESINLDSLQAAASNWVTTFTIPETVVVSPEVYAQLSQLGIAPGTAIEWGGKGDNEGLMAVKNRRIGRRKKREHAVKMGRSIRLAVLELEPIQDRVV